MLEHQGSVQHIVRRPNDSWLYLAWSASAAALSLQAIMYVIIIRCLMLKCETMSGAAAPGSYKEQLQPSRGMVAYLMEL